MIPLLRACLKTVALVLLVLAIFPVQWLLLPFDTLASRSARLWHRAVCKVLGLSIDVIGQPLGGVEIAFVGNHLSYLDIPLLGSVLRGSFVAKREMRQWPLLGMMAKLQRTVFISRVPGDARAAVDQVEAALAAGRNLILFPEGTTSDGSRVLPFKSSVFAVLLPRMVAGLRLQPVSLDLLSVDGHLARDSAVRNRYAYHSEMVLGPHLWAFMHARGAHLRLCFHPPLDAQRFAGRKQLAQHMREIVASGLNSALGAEQA